MTDDLPPLSEAPIMPNVIGQHGGPTRLYNAWAARQIMLGSMRNTLANAWTFDDEPITHLDHDLWLGMFRAAGWLKVPTNLPDLAYPVTIYRGSTEDRARRMSWTTNRETAVQHASRHGQHGSAWVYETVVTAEMVLAYLNTRRECEVIVDPAKLGPIERTAPRATRSPSTPC